MAWQDTRWRARPPRPGTVDDGPVLDMTPDGRFAAPTAHRSPIPMRVFAVAVLVAVLAGAAAIALLALWLALQLIPIAIGAGLIAYGVFRFRAWQGRSGSIGRQRDVFRP